MSKLPKFHGRHLVFDACPVSVVSLLLSELYGSQCREFAVVTVSRSELSGACLGRSVLPADSQPARAVRSAPTRGDTLDKLNSDKSACQYDLNRGRYFLSTSCHISAPSGLILPATWLGYGRKMIKE